MKRALSLAALAWGALLACEAHAADVAAGDTRPALHAAAYDGRLDTARQLLERGADPNATNSWGARPLHEAARSEKPSAEMALLLIEHGADVNAVDGNGGTPLHTAVKGFTGCMDDMVPFWIKTRITNGRLKIAETLLAYGANINAVNQRGQTPLASAREEKNSAAARLLETRGGK